MNLDTDSWQLYSTSSLADTTFALSGPLHRPAGNDIHAQPTMSLLLATSDHSFCNIVSLVEDLPH